MLKRVQGRGTELGSKREDAGISVELSVSMALYCTASLGVYYENYVMAQCGGLQSRC